MKLSLNLPADMLDASYRLLNAALEAIDYRDEEATEILDAIYTTAVAE